MEPVSDRFLEQIRRSHTVVSYVEIRSPSQEVFRLPAIGGSVQVDVTSSVRRSCTVSCIDTDGTLTPTGVDSIMTPYGTEIRPYRGVRYDDDGTVEVVQLGVFRLARVSVRDSVGGSPTLDLEAYDLSRTISRDKFAETYVIASGTDVITAIKAIIERTVPSPEYDTIGTTQLTTASRVYDAGEDPWVACLVLAQSIGCDIHFSPTGVLTVAPAVDIDALPAPCFTYIEGTGCAMLDLQRVFTDEPGYNGVVVTGESPGDELPPVRAVAWDEEPTSATYRLGPYGEVPMFITDQIVKTQEQAQAMADGILRQLLGFSTQIAIDALVNPALEVGDVVEVSRYRSHVAGLFAVDAFSVPLSTGETQSLTLRQKRTVA